MYQIAIIEDDAPVSDTFKKWLIQRWKDAEVDQFSDLQSASIAISAKVYDLVISDIDLGRPADKYGGVKIASMLRGRNVPVLVVSGLPQPDLHREVLLALDAWDYMQKPVTETDFANQAKHALQWRDDHLKTKDSEGPPASDSNLVLDPLGRVRATWKGTRVGISITQLRLVNVLVKNVNQIVEFAKLYDVLESGKNIENLRVHMQGIRDAFREADSEFKRVVNVPMVGYSWRTDQ